MSVGSPLPRLVMAGPTYCQLSWEYMANVTPHITQPDEATRPLRSFTGLVRALLMAAVMAPRGSAEIAQRAGFALHQVEKLVSARSKPIAWPSEACTGFCC